MAEIDLSTLLKLSGGNRPPLASLANLAEMKNSDDVDAENLAGIAGSFGALSPLAAIAKGVTQGAAMTKKEKAQRRRDLVAQHMQELADWEANMAKHRAEMEDLLQADAYAKVSQGHLVNGLQMADQFGDTSEVDRFIRANPSMLRVMQSQLPDGATYTGVSMQTGGDGAKYLVATGTLPDGSVVSSSKPMNIDSVLSTFAPDVLAARAAARIEASKQQSEAHLAEEKVRTERSRGESYDALSEQRRRGDTQIVTDADGNQVEVRKPQKPLSAEAAGKVALVKQGQNSIKRTKALMFDAEGELNRGLVAELSALNAVPFGMAPKGVSEGARSLYTEIYNWNNAKLRLESGAAVPEQEVERATRAYIAGILDSTNTAKAKLQAPEDYFNDYLALIGRPEGEVLAPPTVDGSSGGVAPSASALPAPTELVIDLDGNPVK